MIPLAGDRKVGSLYGHDGTDTFIERHGSNEAGVLTPVLRHITNSSLSFGSKGIPCCHG